MPARLSLPQPPPELAEVPNRRFWGERKPPKNRADMFSSQTVPRAAAETGSSADGGSVATIRMYGPIDSWGGWWGISASDVGDALDNLPDDVTEIRLRINSPGGEAWEGLAILNMLRAHKARVVAVVDGIAASAASFIATGCDETVMSPGTQMMIHDASGFAYGPAQVMRKAADFLDSVSNSIASLYSESAGGTDAEWRALMVEEIWYTAQAAVDSGLADRVGVVLDAGQTDTAGGEPPELDPAVEDHFDLSIYNFAGRSHAPAPAAHAAPKPPSASADGSINTTQEGSTAVAFSDEQLTTMRQELGLPESADEATIVAALSEALAEHAEDPTSNTATVTAVPPGMTLIEADVLETLREQGQAGVSARQQQLDEKRDRVIDQALADGKILPARKDHWVASWAADAEGTEQTLNALAPGLVPVAERGHDQTSTTGGSAYDALYGDKQKGA